ncbi:acyltransferase family protein [Paenibacillus planticolens]|nr:acyltransferase [Paenibacillus planticolens]
MSEYVMTWPTTRCNSHLRQLLFQLISPTSLRGLSALSVVLFHFTTMYDRTFGHKESYIFNFKYGSLGVQLFFMISGFVIYMTIIKSTSLKEFIIKRSIRLYPAYITSVIITFLVTTIADLKPLTVGFVDFLINLTMVYGVIPFGIKAVDGVYWSLFIEISFYIICGFLLSIGLINRPIINSFVALILIFTIKILFLNHLLHPILGDLGIVNFTNLFIAGIMFFVLKNSKNKVCHLIMLLCLLFEFCFKGTVAGLFVAAFCLVFYALIYNKLGFINKPFITYLGTISYSLYLIHSYIGYIIINQLEKNGFTNELFIIVPLLVSVGLAHVITFHIEKPVQKYLLNKFHTRKIKTSQDSVTL